MALDIPNLLSNLDPRVQEQSFPVAVGNIIVFEHIGPGETIHLLNLLPTASLGFGNLEQIISFFSSLLYTVLSQEKLGLCLAVAMETSDFVAQVTVHTATVWRISRRTDRVIWKRFSQNSQCPAGDVRFLTCVHV